MNGHNNKKEFEDAVWDRVKNLIEKKGIKQSQLIQKCEEAGMPVTQPELSKLYRRNKKINLYELTAISKALSVSVDFFIFERMPYKEDLLFDSNSKKLLSQAEEEVFRTYFGEYYIYYNVTVEQVDKVQSGKMTISQEKKGYCKVELFIHTGTYLNKKEVIKKYEGRMLITTLLSGAYIIVKNDLIGELCFMTMRHQTFTVKQVECRMALCLTIGAGGTKLPTVHRMLVSRKHLSDEQVERIQPYFDLYGNEIRIEKSKVEELENTLDENQEKDALRTLWRILPEKRYYEVSIELLRKHLHLDREKFALFIANLLRLAETEPYSKIREIDDSLTYTMIRRLPPDGNDNSRGDNL